MYVCIHQARDADSGDFGLVWYTLTDPISVAFLEEQTGILRLNQTLADLGTRVSPIFTAVAFDNRRMDPFFFSINIPGRVRMFELIAINFSL